MKFEIRVGDATHPDVDPPYWILQGNNNISAWGSGFVLAVNRAFGTDDGSPMSEYLRWFDDAFAKNDFPPTLGDIQLVKVGGGNCVVNMITQKECGNLFYKKVDLGIPFRYEAFEECLTRVRVNAELFKQKTSKFPTLVAPRIGCGLAGANYDRTEEIIRNVFDDLDIEYIVFDLPPQEFKNEKFKV